MIFSRARSAALVLVVALGTCAPAVAQSSSPPVELAVAAGRPIRVALDKTVRLTGVGQSISGTLVEPVFAYDRIVLPAGTPVHGHVVGLIPAPKTARVRAMVGGKFSLPSQVVLDFDSAEVDGQAVSMLTRATHGVEHVRRQVAAGAESSPETGARSRAKQLLRAKIDETIASAEERAREALSAVKEPGKSERVKEAFLDRMPYHPQYLHQGTVYDAELQTSIAFGMAPSIPLAPAGAGPAPDSILTARLSSTVDSAKATRGMPVTAVVTKPVFSADHELILAESATLEGEVTFARPARRWHRNGQLRFLFERVRPPAGQVATAMLASLYSVDVGQADRVAIDEEGGATVTNSKTRFVAPALAVLALHESLEEPHHHFDNDGDPYDLGQIPAGAASSGHRGSRALGGWFGFGALGVGLSQISRPVGIAFGVMGAVRTIYKNVVGKGDEVSFPAGTPIQVRLAPGKTADK